ncbi:MAG: bifunctional methylenetetrahydrofolate dehydrogenase/methenyltetrahydrofolate cyclohydrolase FolD [Candidatus Accumulibacter sp.]|jgi:methylenetetrahydrofolate dehydrogenase (NADP+)/methenyltetrahydrofolate cyclohydrolase|nr:bifunctional methylenetetrahydrofolate dehydrogenase/methenyltetrahydrofolate cyclohydrolase FolD [Accumulibacter sp.]
MTAQILDGKALGQKLRADFRQRAERLASQDARPGLAVILVGDDPASQVYVRNKVDACAQTGFYSERHVYSANVEAQTVFARIAELNADPKIHGILVQLPLPRHFDADAVLEAIAPDKDVDGFRAENLGALTRGRPCFIPCTPHGVMKFFEEAGIPIKGREAVVVGRSNIVGKPMALLLMHAGATVTVCHSQTRDLKAHCRRADILVVAVGKAKMITGDMIKPGAVVIDVGMNRLEDGKLCGDVDFASAKDLAAFITPVPGGVGPMTITMLLANTLESAERAANAGANLWRS